MTKLELLNQIEKETNRFLSKLKKAKERVIQDEKSNCSYCGSYEFGAVKRAALDLKMELTLLNKPL